MSYDIDDHKLQGSAEDMKYNHDVMLALSGEKPARVAFRSTDSETDRAKITDLVKADKRRKHQLKYPCVLKQQGKYN